VSGSIEHVPLFECAPAFIELGIEGTFARYLLARIPNAAMLRWTGAEGQVAISGAPHGHFEASFTWVLGGRLDAALAFVEHLAKRPHVQAYVSIAHRDAIASAFPELAVGKDHVYTLRGEPTTIAVDARIVRMHADTELTIAPDLQHLIPPPKFRKHASFSYWAVVEGDNVVALAESTVDDGRFTVIQQVHTSEAVRGRGLGRTLVAEVCRDIALRGRTATYICAESNAPSNALATALGMSLSLELGCVERQPAP
jgi:ribosomal protein S18 acetylase RimI-like enzyme